MDSRNYNHTRESSEQLLLCWPSTRGHLLHIAPSRIFFHWLMITLCIVFRDSLDLTNRQSKASALVLEFLLGLNVLEAELLITQVSLSKSNISGRLQPESRSNKTAPDTHTAFWICLQTSWFCTFKSQAVHMPKCSSACRGLAHFPSTSPVLPINIWDVFTASFQSTVSFLKMSRTCLCHMGSSIISSMLQLDTNTDVRSGYKLKDKAEWLSGETCQCRFFSAEQNSWLV